MNTTADPMTDTTAAPLFFLVHETTNRGKRYVAGRNKSGSGLVVSLDQADAHRFDTEADAREVVTKARAQYRGVWGVTTVYPRRKPTMSQDEIAARVAARRAARR